MIACHRNGNGWSWSQIASRIDYEKLYSDLGFEPISTNGAEDKGYCLLTQNHQHGDTTGKLAINREKAVYNCWVCGGGTILSLVMEAKGLRHDEALHYLTGFVDAANRESVDDFQSRVARLLELKPEQASKSLPIFNERVMAGWDKHHEWFTTRHISDDTRRLFKAGFDPMARRYTPEFGAYEGPAIILPHFWQQKLVGWQSRWLDSGRPKWVQKYTNTSDFPRENTVYGLDQLAEADESRPILCESAATVLYLHSQGQAAIATFGSQCTENQLRQLRTFHQGIVLAPDNDIAGRKWLTAATKYLERYIPVQVVDFVEGDGADLGDLTPEELSEHLQGAKYAQEISEGR